MIVAVQTNKVKGKEVTIKKLQTFSRMTSVMYAMQFYFDLFDVLKKAFFRHRFTVIETLEVITIK